MNRTQQEKTSAVVETNEFDCKNDEDEQFFEEGKWVPHKEAKKAIYARIKR